MHPANGLKTMSPINPIQPELKAPGFVPPIDEESPNDALVRQGMDIAEDELRSSAALAYPESDSPDDFLEDTTLDEEGNIEAPEIAALHEELIPELD